MSTQKKSKINLLKESREFMEQYTKEQTEKIVRRRKKEQKKVGRPAMDESKRRNKNVIKVYVSDEEKDIIDSFVGDRRKSDVIRELILLAVEFSKAKL